MPVGGRQTYKKHRKQLKKTQKGGKNIYMDFNQISIPTIESIFCHGRTIAELPKQDNPVYILKWGPPGSGKSSSKLDDVVKAFGYPLDSYMDFNSDVVIESILPYRMQTAIVKAKALRMQANYELHDYAHIKELLQLYASRTNYLHAYFDKELMNRCKTFLEEWNIGQSLDSERKHFLDSLIQDITNDETSAIYKYTRRSARNLSGASIQDKLQIVLRSAFSKSVNIIDESTGARYGENTTSLRTFKDQLTGRRFSKRQQEKDRSSNLIDVYINSKETLLGKIKYNELNEPIGIDESSITADSIPMNYKIYVLYPILPKTDIYKRLKRRAMLKFTEQNAFTFPKNSTNIEKYKNMLNSYFKEMSKALGINQIPISNIVDRIVREEEIEYKESYSSYIQSILTSIDSINTDSIFSTPMFSGIAKKRIEEAIEAAFHYSIDYFLKQYLIIGRIERVIYISTLN